MTSAIGPAGSFLPGIAASSMVGLGRLDQECAGATYRETYR